MMALYNRDTNHNGGEVIDLSLAEAVFKATGGSLPTYSLTGSIYERCGNRIRFFVPAENFETKDGKIIAINAGTEKLWRQLVKFQWIFSIFLDSCSECQDIFPGSIQYIMTRTCKITSSVSSSFNTSFYFFFYFFWCPKT